MKGENKQLSVQNLEKAVQIVPEYRTVPFCSIRQAARCVTGLLKILLRHAAKTGMTTFFSAVKLTQTQIFGLGILMHTLY